MLKASVIYEDDNLSPDALQTITSHAPYMLLLNQPVNHQGNHKVDKRHLCRRQIPSPLTHKQL